MKDENFQKIIDFKNDLEEAINKYKKEGKEVLNASAGKDIVVTIGNTGAGKSTLLNLLVGNKLQGSEAGYQLAEEGKPNSCRIGMGSTSETLIPSYLQGDSYLFFDLPSLTDTRGPGIAFLNATCIKNIITQAKSVRFLFVESEASLDTQRAQSFKNLLVTILKLLSDPKKLDKSSLLVVTKSNSVYSEKLVDDFMRKKLDNELLKDLEKFLSLKEPYSVFPFVNPNKYIKQCRKTKTSKLKEEEMMEELGYVCEDVKEFINNMQQIKVPEINPTVLLNQGTEDLISGLLKVYTAEVCKECMPKTDNLTLDKLRDLRKNLAKNLRENFEKALVSKLEINFLKDFDSKLYQEQYQISIQDLDRTINELDKNITIQISDLEKKESEKKVKELDEAFKQSQIKAKEEKEAMEKKMQEYIKALNEKFEAEKQKN